MSGESQGTFGGVWREAADEDLLDLLVVHAQVRVVLRKRVLALDLLERGYFFAADLQRLVQHFERVAVVQVRDEAEAARLFSSPQPTSQLVDHQSALDQLSELLEKTLEYFCGSAAYSRSRAEKCPPRRPGSSVCSGPAYS